MGKLDGKVAVVTGAARGQGRSHAVTLAEAGADVIAVDICADIENVKYPLATPADLDDTRRLVEKLDRRAVTFQADVREPSQLRAAVDGGVAELGRLDIVVANAGIAPLGPGLPGSAFLDSVNVNFLGVVNLVTAAYPHLEAGASIIATGSVAAMLRGATDLNQQGTGGAGYSLSKREVARFVHDLALALAPESIRVNAVHPGNVNTDMLHNPSMYKIFRPDLEAATREDFEPASAAMFPLPISWLEPRDISAAVVFLASDDARYITGQQLRVDGGVALKHMPALPNP
jgi:SDR family mycofactocin-dependent oxidoreductase